MEPRHRRTALRQASHRRRRRALPSERPHAALQLLIGTCQPDDPALHRYLLAYASDFSLISTALDPHAVSFATVQVASMITRFGSTAHFGSTSGCSTTPRAPALRVHAACCEGAFFDRSGRLVASVVQDGLIRKDG